MWTSAEKKMVYDKIFDVRKKMVENGFPVKKISNVKYSNAVSVYGRCKRHKDNTVTITISEITLRAGSLVNTIIHELVHAIDVPNNIHHNSVWKNLAKEVGDIFNENITRCAKSSNTSKEIIKSKWKYVVKCKDCGREYHYIRASKAVQNIASGNSMKYKCLCGSYNLIARDM